MKAAIINILAVGIMLTMMGQIASPICQRVDDVTPYEMPVEEGDDDNKKESEKDKLHQTKIFWCGHFKSISIQSEISQFIYFEISRDVVPPPPKV